MKKDDSKVKELEEKWKRAAADYANLEKRIERERQDYAGLATAQLLAKLLKIADDLELSLKHLSDEGLKIIYRQLVGILESEGVAEIEALGKDFDPTRMEASEMVQGPKNKVVDIVLKGYTLNGKVLRPAKVKVGAGNPTTGEKEKSVKVEREVLRGDYV